MAATITILKEKITGNFKLAAVKRVAENGHVTFGFAVARRGGKWSVGYGLDEKQAMLRVRKHNVGEGSPDILIAN